MPIRERLQQRRFPSLADEAVVSLMVAAEHLDQAVAPIWERHGVTADQYNVLRILRGVYPGGHPRNEVARRMIHTITKAELALLDRIDPEVLAVQKAVTAALTEPKLRQLVRLCDALVP